MSAPDRRVVAGVPRDGARARIRGDVDRVLSAWRSTV